MVAVFLTAEASSGRYGPQVFGILDGLGQPHGIVTDPDTRDEAANAIRRRILAGYRGYPADGVFTGMPADVTWHYAALTAAELSTVCYLDYSYWTDFSGGSRLAADGARRLGPWHDQPPDSMYRQIAENLRDGQLPPLIIVIGEPGPESPANLVVVEGHKRLTGLLVCPQWLPAELEVMLGLTASHHK